MFLLLIAAIAAIALAAAMVTVTRARGRGRQDQLARQSAAVQARAAARAEDQRRRAMHNADDELTSVIPAIRLPWPTQFAAREPGYRDLDGEYPQFSSLSPFQTAPADAAAAEAPWPPAARGQQDQWDDARPDRWDDARPDRWDDARPDRWDDGQLVPPPRPEPAGPAQYPATPAWDERSRPVPAADPRMAPAAVPAEHAEYAAAVERSRRRPTHGSHRGGHARRRRG
jgi:hypothetical protein